MTYQEFVETYKPMKNRLNPAADFDGTLFATTEFCKIGPEVMRYRKLWSVYKQEVLNPETGLDEWRTFIIPGTFNGQVMIGYMVTEVPYEYGHSIVVLLE